MGVAFTQNLMGLNMKENLNTKNHTVKASLNGLVVINKKENLKTE